MNELIYDNRDFFIVIDETISASDHCKYCDFKDLCDKYIDEVGDFACGAVFHANRIYLKEKK